MKTLLLGMVLGLVVIWKIMTPMYLGTVDGKPVSLCNQKPVLTPIVTFIGEKEVPVGSKTFYEEDLTHCIFNFRKGDEPSVSFISL